MWWPYRSSDKLPWQGYYHHASSKTEQPSQSEKGISPISAASLTVFGRVCGKDKCFGWHYSWIRICCHRCIVEQRISLGEYIDFRPVLLILLYPSFTLLLLRIQKSAVFFLPSRAMLHSFLEVKHLFKGLLPLYLDGCFQPSLYMHLNKSLVVICKEVLPSAT